jgi:NADH dehydrogenase
VRFNYGSATFETAVENTKTLFRAAKEAGVRRVVHVSVTNPSENSAAALLQRESRLEKALIESGLSYAIVRPTVTFGDEDILINSIAWLRRFPVFAILGEGDYRVQPIFVEDVAN